MNFKILFYKHFWEEKYYNTKWGFKNLFTHFKIVWSSRPWSFDYSVLEMFKFKLEMLSHAIENGHEEEVSRDNKVRDIKRCIELINNRLEDNYLDRMGGLNSRKYPFEFIPCDDKPEDHPQKTYQMKEFRSEEERDEDRVKINKSYELDNAEWKELWDIIKNGSDGEYRDARGWWD